jgi:chromosome segregation ATPase
MQIKGHGRVTYPDFAEALQARICADLEAERIAHTPAERREAEGRGRDEILEAHSIALGEALARAEALSEQRRQETETAAKKIAELEGRIATLQQTIVKADAFAEQQRQEAQAATKQADHLVAELVQMTAELVDMSKQVAEQTTAIDKLQTELDDCRSRS